MSHELDVFINCAFDASFRPVFEAVHFTIQACGYNPRCALEEDDGFDLRFNKLHRIVSDCPRSVHDLSRTQLNQLGLPRFNMPFELGLMMGAKHFGGRKHKEKTALIMVEQLYKMPAYLSDLSGADPSAHNGDCNEAIKIVRRYLNYRPSGAPLPGARHITDAFEQFGSVLPHLAAELQIRADEIDAFVDYRTYAHLSSAFLKNSPVI